MPVFNTTSGLWVSVNKV